MLLKSDIPIRFLDDAAISDATAALDGGKLVALPTETVYGLGGDAHSDSAVESIFATKGRPSFNPLIVHVADMLMTRPYVEWTPAAAALAEEFWPGPLTLVLRKHWKCPLSSLVTAGLDTVAIRMPLHPSARRIIKEFGRGIAAPSANRSGRISPTKARHVAEEFAENSGNLAMILDGGPTREGLESTVVYCADPAKAPVILRTGTLTREALQFACPEIVMATDVNETQPSSPGMLLKHYSPDATMRLNAKSVNAGEVLLAFGEPLSVPEGTRVENLSASGCLAEAASNLFAMMRALDACDAAGIAVMSIPKEGIGVAMNDRLSRAAAPADGRQSHSA